MFFFWCNSAPSLCDIASATASGWIHYVEGKYLGRDPEFPKGVGRPPIKLITSSDISTESLR